MAVLESLGVSPDWVHIFDRIIDGHWHLNDVNFRLARPMRICVCMLVVEKKNSCNHFVLTVFVDSNKGKENCSYPDM